MVYRLFLVIAFCVFANETPVSSVILGGGMGGLTSALYLARAELHPVVIEGKTPGGLLTQSHSVQNWPGEQEIEGWQLMEKVRSQASASGVQFCSEEVVFVDFSKRPFLIRTKALDGTGKTREILANSCIIATGTEPNFLKIPGEQHYWGRGVTNCAICDGNLYRNQIVGVVGGGDAAVLEGLYLANIAKQVFIFVRKDAFKASETKRLQKLLAQPNVTVMYGTEVVEVKGDKNGVTGIVLQKKKGAQEELSLNGLFLAIGSKPNTSLFAGQLKLDSHGYIVTKEGQETSIAGVYAVGDVADPLYKQAVSASGDGAKAALQVQQYLSDRAHMLVAAPKLKVQAPSPKTGVIEVKSEEEFLHELKTSTVPIVVDFYATWCGPCKRVAPALETSAKQLDGKVKFLKVNVDQLGDLSRSYGIRAMPTALLFDPSGNILERKVGLDQIGDLLRQLDAQKFK